MKTVLFKNLKFGVHVNQYDNIKPYPTSCGLVRICNEDDLINLQKSVNGDLEVVIDNNQPWFSKFTIPAWRDTIQAHEQGKKEMLNSWNTNS